MSCDFDVGTENCNIAGCKNVINTNDVGHMDVQKRTSIIGTS
jgi:hypothetical protein